MTRAPEPRAKSGYSLLEMLVVLAIMAIAAVLVVPSGFALTGQMTAHAEQFDFERQVIELRREAYDQQTPIMVYSTSGLPDGEPRGRVLSLRPGWTYRLSPALTISEGGVCNAATAILLHLGAPVMRLVTADGSCAFTRLAQDAGPPAAS
ncbi:MAG: type II secretion system protein, partial [Caulobacteraceae bacterium]